jgi:hypothetical protein
MRNKPSRFPSNLTLPSQQFYRQYQLARAAATTDGEISDVRLAHARRQIALKINDFYGAR